MSRTFCVVLTFSEISLRSSIGATAAIECTSPDRGRNAKLRLPLDVIRVSCEMSILSYKGRMITFEIRAGTDLSGVFLSGEVETETIGC